MRSKFRLLSVFFFVLVIISSVIIIEVEVKLLEENIVINDDVRIVPFAFLILSCLTGVVSEIWGCKQLM